jgi:CRP/FNR family transcriptional regulator, anaerobic regulatory protein
MNETNKLRTNIDSIVPITEAEWKLFSGLFELRELKKNDFFLKEGQVCDYVGFVNKGALVYFKMLDSGTEVTTDFAFENDWVTNNQSRLSNSPSHINIKAIETTEMLVVKNQDLSNIYIQLPKIERLGRILIEQAFVRITQQSIDLQLLSAKERYEHLLLKSPEIIQRAPLYHIANYLGIAPKSLSRIRKESLQ